MKVYLASDHAGLELKDKIKAYLLEGGHDAIDCGALEFDKDDDYPDIISKAAIKVSEDEGAFGIVLGKSGAGEAIVANKIKGIRAVLGFNKENVLLSRTHNNANVLSLGSDFVSDEEAGELVKLFLETPFSEEERHKRRIDKIASLEGKS